MNYRKDSIDFVVHTLLLMTTLRLANQKLGNLYSIILRIIVINKLFYLAYQQQIKSKMESTIKQLPPEIRNDNRVNNLWRILLLNEQ